MNLIWGHQHYYKRPTYEPRIFKYTDRGFGFRIFPCYMKASEHGSHKRQNSEPLDSTYVRVPELYKRYANLDAYRRPVGAEPGLKTLKRVAELGTEFVERLIHQISMIYNTGQIISLSTLPQSPHFEDKFVSPKPNGIRFVLRRWTITTVELMFRKHGSTLFRSNCS